MLLFSQVQLNDLTRNLCLSKESAHLLGSRLKESNILASNTKCSYYRNRDEYLRKYFSIDHKFVYCNDIKGLIMTIGISYNSRNGDYSLIHLQKV